LPTRNEPKTGEVWDARLSPTVGGEQWGTRPVLVVSNDWFNGLRNDLYMVMPITGTDRGLTFQYKIPGREAGLSKHSVIMCDQVRSISGLRFVQLRGRVSVTTLAAVRERLKRFVEDEPVYMGSPDVAVDE